MRRAGVLIGTTGRQRNTLKIRPPLAFSRPDADRLVATLEDVAQPHGDTAASVRADARD